MNRDQIVSLRFTADELDAIEGAADDAGVPRAAWLRLVALGAAGASALQEQIRRAKQAARKKR